MFKWLASLIASCAASSATPSTPTVTSSSSTDCITACTRYRICAPNAVDAREVDSCIRDCNSHLAPTSQAKYAACMTALTCESVEQSLTLDEGSTGACYSMSRY
jgi:hypothetical protein